MRINDPEAYVIATEEETLSTLVNLTGCRVLELGCGDAMMTRRIADGFTPEHIVATEVDRIQLEKNLAVRDLPNVTFRYGGAEAIDDPDNCYDAVFMFKSLHHVPGHLLEQALTEIHRVLKPGGLACFSEPVYWGEFNELMRLINEEEQVREAAFAALQEVVTSGFFELETELFFSVPGTYETWERFENRFIKITHTELHIDDTTYERIKAGFLERMTPTGVHFHKPQRIDLLRKP
ncbi:MAG: class I SAM-dependent methyltransferase [Gammaproteobacteria bacterium]|nr:class I SAM-dependent methyltransferase [Gammaproteobacteria bacterium]